MSKHEFTLETHSTAVEVAAAAALKRNPLLDFNAAQQDALAVVEALVEEGLIIEPKECEYTNPEKTVHCTNLAPVGLDECYDH